SRRATSARGQESCAGADALASSVLVVMVMVTIALLAIAAVLAALVVVPLVPLVLLAPLVHLRAHEDGRLPAMEDPVAEGDPDGTERTSGDPSRSTTGHDTNSRSCARNRLVRPLLSRRTWAISFVPWIAWNFERADFLVSFVTTP